MPNHPTEKKFEDHIEKHLKDNGYKSLNSSIYNKELCLIPKQVVDFIKITQEKEYQKLEKQYGDETDNKLCRRLSQEIERRGVIDVLRKGIKDRGSRFYLVYFEPKSTLNKEHQNLFTHNQFALIRQFKYSEKNENSIDIGIFINGIPVVMLELKNELTGQSHLDGIKQWKDDRDPKEPLFKFKRNLVYFSIGNEKAYMTTELKSEKTFFFPFNKGEENPINPNGAYKTHYIWEEVLQIKNILDLIENFVHIRTEKKKVYDNKKSQIIEKKKDVLIFPRYHQFNLMIKLKKSIIEEGVGNNYLIQHTTGSGKSLSIAWLANILSSLYRKPNDKERMFSTIIIVTDRKILDKQIKDTVLQLEIQGGVVAVVNKDSQQLKEFIEQGKTIIITTVQKFPVISESISELENKRFGVIIDEVHSSQSGETAKHLVSTVSKHQINEEISTYKSEKPDKPEDRIIEAILSRGKQKHISYFGFTGTPKNQTLEIFGKKTDDGQFVSFDTYSMKQSIAEGFTLDVLQSYTTYKRYFKLNKDIEEDKKFPKSRVRKMLVKWVDNQDYTIKSKIEIMLEHFVKGSSKEINGQARAMVVVRSRKHCVKYKLEFDKQIKQMNLQYGCLVGFSGKKEEHTESSMNGFSETKTSIKFKEPQFRILIVCDKYQTGFDEPLLQTMYIDKTLKGLQCVQTLSRLNRTMEGKAEPFILDFVNDTESVKEAFKPYYEETILSEETDPNKLYSIEQEIKKFQLFEDSQVEQFIKLFYGSSESIDKLQDILDDVVQAWKELDDKEKQEDFRRNMHIFVSLYGYIARIVSFVDINLEKLFIFLKFLCKKIPKREQDTLLGIQKSMELKFFRIQKQKDKERIPLEAQPNIDPTSIGEKRNNSVEEEEDLLSNIIKKINDIFGADLSKDDEINLKNVIDKMNDNDELKKFCENSDNTKSNKIHKIEESFQDIVYKKVDSDIDFYNKFQHKDKIKKVVKILYELLC